MEEDKIKIIRRGDLCLFILIFLPTIILSLILGSAIEHRKMLNLIHNEELLEDSVINSKKIYLTEFDYLTLAFAEVESEVKFDVVNKTTGATGVGQIMPIYVREVNNIINADNGIDGPTFTLSDRKDPEKTVLMIDIFTEKHNPTANIELAIYKHNPTAFKKNEYGGRGESFWIDKNNWYAKRVYAALNKHKRIEIMRDIIINRRFNNNSNNGR